MDLPRVFFVKLSDVFALKRSTKIKNYNILNNVLHDEQNVESSLFLKARKYKSYYIIKYVKFVK